MAFFLKKGKCESELLDSDSTINRIVADTLAQIEKNGDAAVRELSAKFDNWSPPSFRLSDNEIQRILASVPSSVIDDIKFAQEQIRNFAQ